MKSRRFCRIIKLISERFCRCAWNKLCAGWDCWKTGFLMLTDWLQKNNSKVKKWAKDVWLAILDWVNNAKATVAGWVKHTWSVILERVKNLWSDVVSWVNVKWDNSISWITRRKNRLVDFFRHYYYEISAIVIALIVICLIIVFGKEGNKRYENERKAEEEKILNQQYAYDVIDSIYNEISLTKKNSDSIIVLQDKLLKKRK